MGAYNLSDHVRHIRTATDNFHPIQFDMRQYDKLASQRQFQPETSLKVR